METLKCGVYVATQQITGVDHTFVVLVDARGNQSWLRLNPSLYDKLYYYTEADAKPRNYTMINISEALQKVFCATP